MKHIRSSLKPLSLLAAFVLLSAFVLAPSRSRCQNVREQVEYRSPYIDLRPISCEKVCRYSDGKPEGEFSISGKDLYKGSKRTDSQRYSEVRHYLHGVLQGPFSQDYTHHGSGDVAGSYLVDRNWSVKGQFADGQPDGTWVFSVDSKIKARGENGSTRYRMAVDYEHGTIKKISDERGNSLLVNEDGSLTGSATLKDGTQIVMMRSVVTGSYLNKEGDRMRCQTEQADVLNSSRNPFEMADRGYAIDYQDVFLQQSSRLADMIDRYSRITSICKGFQKIPYSVRVGQLRQVDPVSAAAAFEYYFQSPGKADQMLKEGWYINRGSKRFFGTEGEKLIRRHYTEIQKEMLDKKLSLMVKTMEGKDWDGFMEECRSGKSPILDLFAVRWSREGLTRAEQIQEASVLIEKNLKPIFPLSGFEIRNARYTPYEGLSSLVVMHRRGHDTVSYESVAVPLKTGSSGYMLLSRLNPSEYSTEPNDWDTIARFESRLRSRCAELMARLRPMKEWSHEYQTFFDSVMSDRSIRPEVRMEDLEYLDEVQQEVWENADLLKEIHKAHEQLRYREQSARREQQSHRHKESYLEHCRHHFPNVFWSRESLSRFRELQREYGL